jgi:hypothetical protein
VSLRFGTQVDWQAISGSSVNAPFQEK